jgi:hypothetical protein
MDTPPVTEIRRLVKGYLADGMDPDIALRTAVWVANYNFTLSEAAEVARTLSLDDILASDEP